MNRETKSRLTLIGACLVALVALFTRLELYPEPPTKGFCGFVGPCVSCADVSR